MERAKLANGSGHRSVVSRSLPQPAKKRDDAVDQPEARPLRKKVGRKPKAEKLVCRYCGSDDLAPSFIRRRDRRCRKCFGKRYGSTARTKKARVKK